MFLVIIPFLTHFFYLVLFLLKLYAVFIDWPFVNFNLPRIKKIPLKSSNSAQTEKGKSEKNIAFIVAVSVSVM